MMLRVGHRDSVVALDHPLLVFIFALSLSVMLSSSPTCARLVALVLLQPPFTFFSARFIVAICCSRFL